MQDSYFLGLRVATYSDHIEVKPVLRDLMSIQEIANVPAADNEIAIRDGRVAIASFLIGKLQRMTKLIGPDLSKKPNDALSLQNTRATLIKGKIRALNIVIDFTTAADSVNEI